MRKLFASLLITTSMALPLTANAFLVVDVLRVSTLIENVTNAAKRDLEEINKMVDELNVGIGAAGESVDAINNAAANKIVRLTQQSVDNNNNQLAKEMAAVDVCNNVKVNDALNQLACDYLEKQKYRNDTFFSRMIKPARGVNLSEFPKDDPTNIQFVGTPKNPELVDADVSNIAQATVAQQNDTLAKAQKRAIFTTSYNAANAYDLKKEMLDAYENQITENQTADTMKGITSTHDDQSKNYTQGQVIRVMAVFKAQNLSIQLEKLKGELAKEKMLATYYLAKSTNK